MAPLPWPDNSEFVPLTVNGVPYSAPRLALNCTPNNPQIGEGEGDLDIVGTTALPPAFFASDGTYAFFRFRLRDDAIASPPDTFHNGSWIVLFDTDNNLANSYEWELALDGNTRELIIKQNTVKNSPGKGFNDQAEVLVATIPFPDLEMARSIPAGSNVGLDGMDYFLDFGISIADLTSYMGIAVDSPLRFSYLTSQNVNNFNKDRLCCSAADGSFLSSCFSDPISFFTILTGKVVNKDTGCPVVGATVEIFDTSNTLIATVLTDGSGTYTFMDLVQGNYYLKVTKNCYLPNCRCNLIFARAYAITTVNISLAPDCICEVKCLIAGIENEVVAEKQRIYQIFTDFFLSTSPSMETLCRYVSLMDLLNDCTAELDCCVACVMETLGECEEGDNNDCH